ncbi:CMRF35-like molecule 5 [Chanodichthys erythropterus]|uniref:CMRF35-like molecule 5 n=1 Tax=Chanodichthys erythropterus TaxID=933992 RepID=UPI00351EF3F2
MKIILTFTLLMIPGVVSSISVMGYSGGGVTIRCKYDEGYTANKKYFCKGQWSDCTDQIKTDEKDKWVQKDRFSLYDDTRSAVFTVTIRNLTELDSDTYWCAVDKLLAIDSHNEVNLKVIRETNNHRTSSTSLPSSSSSSVESPAITSVSPVTGSSLVVSVSVILLLIIIGLVFVIGIFCRRRQSHTADSSSDRSHTTPGSNEEVSHADCDYEEIRNIHRQLPTTPSDSFNTVYATPQLPTTPSDSSNTVNATPQLPTNPSDSSNMVYATAQ